MSRIDRMSVLEHLFPRVRVRLLQELFREPGREIHLRQLARQCGVAVGTLQDEITQLNPTGLLRKRRKGNRLLIAARAAHPLYPEIESMIRKTTRPRVMRPNDPPPATPAPVNPVVIRPAGAGDLDVWWRMRRKLWPGHGDHAREIRAYLAQPPTDAVALLAVHADGRAAGFMELGLRSYAEGCSSSPVAYIEGWWVAPSDRRRGVGRALMEAATVWARDQGILELASDCDPCNTPSSCAHRSCGFEDAGLIRCFRKTIPA